MELDANKFSQAATITMGIVYIVCAVFVVLLPAFSLQLFGWMVHLVNVDKFAGGVQITLLSFLVGLIQILVYTYLIAYLFARLCNKFSIHK